MKTGHHRPSTMYIALASFAALLTGCTVGPRYHVPTPAQPPPVAYKEIPQSGDGWQIAQPQDAMLRGKWWEIFADPELNALEEQVEINNQTVKQYFEDYMEARALVSEARTQYFPTITVGTGFNRSRSSANLKNSSSSSANTGNGSGTGTTVTTNKGSESTLWSAPLDISWEPDLWGKIRNQVKQEVANAQLSAADLENERLAEQASLAEYFFEIRGQDALIQVFNDTIENDRKSLAYTQNQYDAGIGDQISVVEARNTLQAAEASATNLQVARAQYEHAIAVLIGRNASEFSIPVKPMLTAPPPIPLGVPSALIQRRPDVAAAERTLAAANAEIGIGYAAFLPSLTLTADGGFEASSLKHWFDWPSRFWSIGPSFSQTIYDAGLFRAALNQYSATYNADVAAYRQTILTAFEQVEDYLAAVRIYSNQIKQEQAAVDSAQTYVKLETARYETGIDPYVNLVTAQNTLLADRQTLTTIQVDRMTAAVELIQALGGGWDSSQLPSEKQVTARPTAAETSFQR